VLHSDPKVLGLPDIPICRSWKRLDFRKARQYTVSQKNKLSKFYFELRGFDNFRHRLNRMTVMSKTIFNFHCIRSICLTIWIWFYTEVTNYTTHNVFFVGQMLELLSALKLNDDSDQSRITLADVLIMTYASPAWSGFVTATDCQRIDAFLSRSKRRGFCPAELPELIW